MNKATRLVLLLAMTLLFNALPVTAQEEAELAAEIAIETKLQADIQTLKKDVLELNKNLFILEEDLLFPSNTQFSVFLSMDSGELFSLDAVHIKIDNKVVASHLYTGREIAALKRGGIQRLFIGNIASGPHEIIAIFTGQGPSKRDFRRGETIMIEKDSDPQYLELKIIDDPGKEQPIFKTKVWK